MENYCERIGCFEAVLDPYNGVTIQSETVPLNQALFEDNLTLLLKKVQKDKRNLLWIYLDIKQAHLIASLTAQGFEFHTCESKRILMLKALKNNPIVPTASNHTLGVGVVVINEYREILVIKERISKTSYKLPGGHIDDAEMISTAVQREVLEETGVHVEFESIISLGHFYPHQFNKSNLYIICKAKPKSLEIHITDTQEIEDAQWIDVQNYLEDDEVFEYNKELISLALNTQGMKGFDLECLKHIPKRYELFKLDKKPKKSL